MIHSVKRCLKKTIGRAKLTLAIVNCCPLSYVSTEDTDEPLTPSHLMTGRRLLSLPDSFYYGDRIEDESLISTTDLNKRMIYLNKILENFWQRWNKEYVLELRNTHRSSTFKESNINIGDMVLVLTFHNVFSLY